MAHRALKNAVLGLWSAAPDSVFFDHCTHQFQHAGTMTDQYGALAALVNSGDRARAEQALQAFYAQWREDQQVLEQWFAVQSASPIYAGLAHIQSLMQHPEFEFTNPNKLRAVLGAFCNQNLVNFHAPDGRAYAFLADQIMRLDDLNPQIASRLTVPLTRGRRFGGERQAQMRRQLERIQLKPGLSKDVRELVSKSLAV
jgi:aminopeptidase N